jgi:hypothetical protein
VPEQRVAGGADATTAGDATRPCASHAAARSAASIVDESSLPQGTGDVWRLGGGDVMDDVVLLLDVPVAVREADRDVAIDAALSLCTAWSIEHMRGSASICYTVFCPRVAEDDTEGFCWVCSSSARVGVEESPSSRGRSPL